VACATSATPPIRQRREHERAYLGLVLDGVGRRPDDLLWLRYRVVAS
jgi:hypothetical protein